MKEVLSMKKAVAKNILFALAFVVFVLPAIAGGKKDVVAAPSAKEAKNTKEPMWLHSPKDLYPEAKYITALGQGETLQGATAEAKTALSAYIKQTVSAEQVFTQKADNASVQNNFASNVKTTTKLPELSGLDTNNFFQESKTNFYVLAVLDRNIAGQDLDVQIQNKAQKAQALYTQALNKKGTFASVMLSASSVKQIIQAQELLDLLSCVNASYYATAKIKMQDYISPNDAINTMQECQNALNITIDIKGDVSSGVDCAKEVAGEVANAFAFYGIETNTTENKNNKDSSYCLEGTVRVSGMESPNENKFSHYDVILSLVNAKTKEQALNINVSGREGHLTQQEADRRAAKKAATDTGLAIKAQLEKMLQD